MKNLNQTRDDFIRQVEKELEAKEKRKKKTKKIVIRKIMDYGVEIEAETIAEAIEKAKKIAFKEDKANIIIDYISEKKYTTKQQNNAFHKLWELWAEALNEKGITVVEFFKAKFELFFTKELIKEQIWKPIQKTMFNKKSTQTLENKEINDIYDVINKRLGEKWEIHVPFPEKKLLQYDKIIKNYEK